MTGADLLAAIKKNPISYGCGALAVALCLVTYFRSSTIPERAALLEQKSREGERLAANVRNGALLQDHLNELNAAVKSVDGRLLRAADLAQNLQYFYRLEAETGTKLLELRQLTNATGKPGTPALTGISFSVTLRGEYLGVLEFVRRLEGGPHFCRVTSASMGFGGVDRSVPLTLTLGVELLGQL